MKYSIAYITARRNPRFSWFVESLLRQATKDDLDDMQIVFVDSCLWGDVFSRGYAERYFSKAENFPLGHSGYHEASRREELANIVGGRFHYLHIPPMPCAWSGPFRQTSKDWFSASNQRNTAFLVAEAPYIVCVDDLSILGPDWLNQVKHAALGRYCVAGAYKKLLDMRVEKGELVSFTENPKGVDSRWGHGSDSGIVPWHGNGLYGCSFGLPMSLVEKVDGCDMHCCGEGSEDYIFGIRLERAGGLFCYNRNMVTFESEEGHAEEPSLPRQKKFVTHDRLPDSLKSAYPDGLDSDHVLLQSVLRESRIIPSTPNHLVALRRQWQKDGVVNIPQGPQFDWRDGKNLNEL